MTIFENQKIYCQNCGRLFFGQPEKSGDLTCDRLCKAILEEKYVCYIMGKKWEESESFKFRFTLYNEMEKILSGGCWKHCKVLFSRKPIMVYKISNAMGETLSNNKDYAFLCFIDKEPDANWAHDCLYVLVFKDGNTEKYANEWPPNEDIMCEMVDTKIERIVL